MACVDEITLFESRAAPRAIIDAIESAIGYVVETVAALLVVAEVFILLCGVVARYGLNDPLIWTDELAAILFLWLAALGAVIALRRGQHMRMTAFVSRCTGSARVVVDVMALAGGIIFQLLLLVPAWDYMQNQAMIETPALGLSDAWRVSALPVGIGLMAAFSLLRLLRIRQRLVLASALAAIAVLTALLLLLGPVLSPLGNMNLVIFFVVLVAAGVFVGVPIGFCFGLATFAYLSLATQIPLQIVVNRMDEGMSNSVLLAVPLFVLLGALIEMNGMARAMIVFLASLLRRVRGGLSYVLLGAIYLVSGIAGSKAADMAAVAPVLFPEMKARGSKPGELVALLAATGAMSETIPPSLVLITIGTITNVSIAALFTAGLLPGAVLALALAAVVRYRHRGEDLSHVGHVSGREISRCFAWAIPALVLPVLIRFAVICGIATATEVSTIGILYAVVVGTIFYRQFDIRRLRPILVDTVSLAGAILLIIGTATAMAWALTRSGFSQQLAATMATLPGGRAGFLAVSIVLFVVLGSVLEGIPAVVLFGPLMFPIAQRLGVHEVHYAIVVILAMGIGLFAPPFGVGYYTACAIGQVDPREGMRPIVGYLIALVVGLLVIAAVPWFSTGLL
jgi:tripartite ATP-independent transporter DctM subunit